MYIYSHGQNIVTLTILSENSFDCKCFVIHVLVNCISLFALQQHTQKNREEKSNLIKFHTELKNELDKIIGIMSNYYDAPVICI